MQRVVHVVDAQVNSGGLKIRTDRALHADLGLKRTFAALLLEAYNPAWLRVGLEAVLGTTIDVKDSDNNLSAAAEASAASGAGQQQQKSSHLERALKRMVAQRVLDDPAINAKFGRSKHSAAGGAKFAAEIKAHCLGTFLKLVAFLDLAKRKEVLPREPCLFRLKHTPNNNSGALRVTSTVELLNLFSRDLMQGEGNLVKHLNLLGYKEVKVVQSVLDEFDFGCSNLAVDLRDGVRLAKLVDVVLAKSRSMVVAGTAKQQKKKKKTPDKAAEDKIAAAEAANDEETEGGAGTLVLAGQAGPDSTALVVAAPSSSPPQAADHQPHKSLCSSLRVPAVSRLQKVHNVGVVLAALDKYDEDEEASLPSSALVLAAPHTSSNSSFSKSSNKSFSVSAADVVDGHRDKTLALLWRVMATHDLCSAVSCSKLEEETTAVARAWRWRLPQLHQELDTATGKREAAVVVVRPPASAAQVSSLAATTEALSFSLSSSLTQSSSSSNNDEITSVMAASPTSRVLLRWAQAVCSGYGVPVHDLSNSFSDGRALCCLVHYYHPAMLPLSSISATTASVDADKAVLAKINAAEVTAPATAATTTTAAAVFDGEVDKVEYESLVLGECANFSLVWSVLQELGGVPLMLARSHSSEDPPDPR
jgi:hypothetical protein